MTGKENFSTEEWSKLLESALLASVAVTASEPSGLWGTMKEGFANASSIVSNRDSENPLVRDVVAALSTADGRQIAQDEMKKRISDLPREQIVPACISGLEEVGRIVDDKAREDAAGFKNWLRATAQSVAEAASEDGFLGFGGEQVTANEQATLGQVASALRLQA